MHHDVPFYVYRNNHVGNSYKLWPLRWVEIRQAGIECTPFFLDRFDIYQEGIQHMI
jgi:hypothetical protein